tara:strand:+ start:132 stop:1109 length:978 start_codon:yes stop_codon:yes gene_type:complete
MSKSLKEIISINKPKLSQGSIKTYLSGIRHLALRLNIKLDEPKDFITHKDKLIQYLKELGGLQNGKTKLAGIMAILKPISVDDQEKLDKDTKDAIKDYTDLMLSFKKNYDEVSMNQEMNPTQKANFLPWDDVTNVYNRLKKVADPLFKIDPKFASNDVLDILMHFVILSCYVLIPPRRSLDYTVMKVRNFDEGESSKDNYLLDIKGKYVFVFNNYKNATRLGRQSVEIPTPLKRIIKNWLRFNTQSDYLIPNKIGRQVQPNKINSMLNEIFKANVGSSLLRHSYITSKYGDVDLKKMDDDAKAMGQNDITTLLKYVDKEKANESK